MMKVLPTGCRCPNHQERMRVKMRLVDADKLYEDISNGPGTNLQKMFAACCVAAAPTVNPYEWISVEDRLPEKEGYYIVTEKNANGKIYVTQRGLLYWANGPSWCMSWQERDIEKIKVTHWISLPTPPTEKED